MVQPPQSQLPSLPGQNYGLALAMPSLEQLAQRLHTTNVTLHRRLRNEGTSYQQIKDVCRRDAAIALLRAEPLSGSAITQKLGFSDASTFYRAFKKWPGITPQHFRQCES
jgi:AraC-like DNA-binding protein